MLTKLKKYRFAAALAVVVALAVPSVALAGNQLGCCDFLHSYNPAMNIIAGHEDVLGSGEITGTEPIHGIEVCVQVEDADGSFSTKAETCDTVNPGADRNVTYDSNWQDGDFTCGHTYRTWDWGLDQDGATVSSYSGTYTPGPGNSGGAC